MRALRVCNNEFLPSELCHIRNALSNLSYPDRILDIALKKARTSFYRCQDVSENDSDVRKEIDFNDCVILPYVKTLESCESNVKKIGKKIVFKYNDKLSRLLCKNKLSKKVADKGVYRISCSDCNSIYVGETGRNLKQRVKEHKKDVRNDKEYSAIARHVNDKLHNIDFDSAEMIYPCTDLRKRRIIESIIISSHDDCMNLNNGFSPLNPVISVAISDCLHLNT